MSDNRPPYHRRQTKPLPRVQLAPISTSVVDRGAETKTECPLCEGSGCVTPEERAAWLQTAAEIRSSSEGPPPSTEDAPEPHDPTEAA